MTKNNMNKTCDEVQDGHQRPFIHTHTLPASNKLLSGHTFKFITYIIMYKKYFKNYKYSIIGITKRGDIFFDNSLYISLNFLNEILNNDLLL